MSIFGSGFTGASGVTFGTIPAQGFSVGDDNHLYTTSPAGPIGITVDIKVTTGSGTSAITVADHFTFTASGGPVVSGLDHNHGSAAGGTDLTIFGTGLRNVTSVSFGAAVVQCGTPLQPAAGTGSAPRRWANAAGPQVLPPTGGGPGPCTRSGDTSLTLLTPGGTAGTTVDVIVTTQSGTASAASLADKFTYDTPQAPAVNAVDPNRGSSAGGTEVTLYGSGFSGATSVKFGNQVVAGCGFGQPVGPSRPAARPAAAEGGGCAFGTDTSLTVLSPSGTVFTTVDITVTTPVGTSPLSAADKFTYNMPVIPEVDALSPIQGPSAGGVPVNIFGNGFSGATAVQFGSTVLSLCGGGPTQTCFYAFNDTQLYVQQSPAGTVGTSVHVTVVNSAGTSPPTATDLFSFVAAVKPVVYGLSPSQGPTTGGGSITIYGKGFTGLGPGGIQFGTTTASGYAQGDTMIFMGIPPGAAGTVDVTVTTAGGTSATGPFGKFTYVTPAAGPPIIDGIKPNIGTTSGDTIITVLGSGFTGATAVNFSGTAAASFYVQDDRHLSAHSPPGIAGTTVDITVVTPVGTTVHGNTDHFTFVTSLAPVISFVSPGTGITGALQSTYISGSGFLNGDCTCGVTAVMFGTTPASFFYQFGDNVITVQTPALAAGTVDVTVTTSSGTSAVTAASKYTLVNGPRPVVTALAPSSGPASGQTSVEITGSGFLGASAVNFGTATVSLPIVQSDTLIQVSSPAGTASTTPVDITVTASGGTSLPSAADRFTYTPTPAPAKPTVSGVSPNLSPAGTTVYISGSGFIQGATTVNFGTTAATNVTVDYRLQVLTATSPAQGTMPPTVDITVVTAGGTSAVNADDQYTYGTAPPPLAQPVVRAVSPNTGAAAGGDYVTIFGTGFSTTTAVRFGSVQAFSVYAPNDTTLSVQTPPGTASTTPVDVTVTSPAGTSATSAADRFTYTPTLQPVVYGITPNNGSSSGGTQLAVYGANFTAATSVHFGTALVNSFYVTSPAYMVVYSPPGTASATPVDVTVTTPGGTSASSISDRFTYVIPPIPEVDAISAHSGSSAGNTFMRILGSGLSGATAAHFSGTTIGQCGASATACFFSNGGNLDTELGLNTPPGTAGSTVDVTVTTAGGTSPPTGAGRYTYFTPPIPTVTAVSPATGYSRGATTVQISGSGFAGATAVNFGTKAVMFFDSSDTLITVLSAPGDIGPAVHVTVTTPGGTSTATSVDLYTYTTTPAPVIRALAPASGVSAGGTTVYASGNNLTAASAVTFGANSSLTFYPLADDLLLVQSPPGTASATPVDVRVTTPGGTSAIVAADQYTYTPTPQPAVTAITPSTGPASGGNTVYIRGSGLQYVTAVNFGSSAVSAIGLFIVDDNMIQVTAPAGTASTTPVDVMVTSAGGTSPIVAADRYTFTTTPAPVVGVTSPTGGASAGGTTVYITGSNLSGATAVRFGPNSGVNVQSLSSGVVRTLSPAGTPSAIVHVTVTTSGGTSASTAADQFTYGSAPPARPTVTAVGPSSGPPGTTVYVTGTALTSSSMVKFATGTAGAGSAISDTLLQVGSPPGPPGTSVDVTVTAAGGTSLTSAADKYSYPASASPIVTIVSPSSGPAGTTVYITGQGLSGTTGVAFGSTTASGFYVNSDTLVQVNSPAGSGTVHVTVTTSLGTSPTSAADQYTYAAPAAPVITSISPTSGPGVGGTTVTVNGSGFTGSQLMFGPKAASFSIDSDTKITATSPGGTGTVDLRVTTLSGTSATSSADQFTYTPPGPPPPTVTSVSPASGPPAGGTLVTITGTNFTYVQSVKFGSVAVNSYTIYGSTSIQLTSPAGTAGTVDVTVTTLDGTSAISAADKFTYATQPPVPTVTSINPTSGPAAGGTVVTVTGTGFTGATAVKFGAAGATAVTVDSDTQIHATSPAGSGTVDIKVTTPGGTSAASSADQFTYTATLQPPTVTGVAPNMGPTAGGTVVTITGTNLGGAAVRFGTVTAPITSNTGTQITVTSPAATAPGVVDVTVTTAGGSSAVTPADQFNYGDTVTAINPGQFQMAGNDGSTWQDMDPNGGLSLTISPSANSMAILTGNADLWTTKAGVNQDIGIYVAESDLATYPGHIVAWKESGGYAGTFSPNAAAVQTVFPMTVGTTYHIKLRWKTNLQTSGTIVVGAGPWPATNPTYSPTTLTARLATASQVSSAVSNQQYLQTGSGGATWVDIDSTSGTPLTTTITPTVDSLAVLSGNVDLWTAKAGVNQDVGINVAESDTATYPGHIVAWKESGGYAGTYSPNAAFVQTVFPMKAATTYHLKLQWKTNKVTDGTIVVGAGPWPANVATYSPTRLTVQLMPASALIGKVSNQQYVLANSDGANWSDMDTTTATPLSLTVTPTANCTAIISGNADLWTTVSGYNQDIGISVSPSSATGNIVAWKESGGYAGTYSPNAAFVQAMVSLQANTHYTIKLQWKTNKASNGAAIVVGAGPWPANVPVYSPTTLTAQLFGCG